MTMSRRLRLTSSLPGHRCSDMVLRITSRRMDSGSPREGSTMVVCVILLTS